MTQDRKPTEDLKEGLGLIFRAARTAAKQVDVAKIDKGLDKAVTEVGRVVTRVGRVVADEVNRMAASPPPWSKSEQAPAEAKAPEPPAQEGEGEVAASNQAPAAPSGTAPSAEAGTEPTDIPPKS